MRWTCCLVFLVASCAGHEQAADTSARGNQRGASDVELRVDLDGEHRRISPLIYGVNGHELAEGRAEALPFRRLGGNRTSTYNWENNASNAGEDYHHSSDDYFGQSNEPGRFVLDFIERAEREGAEALITVPLLARVARDKDGPVAANEVGTRFVTSRLGAPAGTVPNAADDVVYQDAFAAHLAARHSRIGVSLDNEPGSWHVTHPRVHPRRTTYAELLARSVDYARALRRVAPDATIYGPASFGFAGWMNLGGAPDANGRDFVNEYLDVMARAERSGGRRLLDVLDVHFYPSVDHEGRPIAQVHGEAAGDLRMQLPRSLYDASYEEPGWITRDYLHEPIQLLPRLRRTIQAHYPGTKLAITEYNYGGGGDISGAVAQADVLGAYGRHGVHAAALWPLWEQPTEFILAAFDVYRRVPGAPPFAEISIPAESSDVARVGVWASTEGDGARLSVVVIHRSRDTLRIRLHAGEGSRAATRAVLDASAARLRNTDDVTPSDGHYDFVSRGPSVTYLSIGE